MFGFFKKNPDRDFEFHKDRTKKLLDDALDKFVRADNYLCGIGLGGDSIKAMSAHGASAKAQSALKEAIYNASEAVKSSQGDPGRVNQLRDVVNSTLSIKTGELFVHPSVVELWEKSRNQWLTEFDRLI